ncbi:hypothetical protein [Paenibacillus sp. WC2504]|uniref:hypothetical protein n=1 Tax=Paenibacillus sp. WC2504 TaxID=3461403 RepID=UPI004045E734
MPIATVNRESANSTNPVPGILGCTLNREVTMGTIPKNQKIMIIMHNNCDHV